MNDGTDALRDEERELRGGTMELIAQDERGPLPLDELAAPMDPRAAAYCCVPEPLIRAVEQVSLRRGRRADLQFEHYIPAPPKPVAGALTAAAGFAVELGAAGARSGFPRSERFSRSMICVGRPKSPRLVLQM